MTEDIVTRLREQAQAPALAWLNDAAAEIERLHRIEQAARDLIEAEPGTDRAMAYAHLAHILGQKP